MAAQKRPQAEVVRDIMPWVALFGGALLLKGVYDYFFPGGHTSTIPGQGTPTLSRAQLSVIAERIYAAANEGAWFYEDEDDMTRALLEINNDADFYALFNVYGIRAGAWAGADRNLIETFQDLLSDEQIAKLNSKLAAKGLTIRL